MPFWFWYVTATLGLGSISIAGYVVVFMKIAELDAKHARERTTKTLG